MTAKKTRPAMVTRIDKMDGGESQVSHAEACRRVAVYFSKTPAWAAAQLDKLGVIQTAFAIYTTRQSNVEASQNDGN